MVKYHPDSRFLTDYAAGSLPVRQAVCVSAHLHYCTTCRNKIQELSVLGGSLFLTQSPVAVDDHAFTGLMSKIDALPDTDNKPEPSLPDASDKPLPHVIDRITEGDLSGLNWKSLGKQLSYSRIDNGRNRFETALLKIKAGCSIPRHSHTGDEITVILKGSFSDHEDCFRRGDFIVRSRGEDHQPVASQDEDCICLISLEAPIRMSNWIYRLLQPLFNMKLA